MKIQSLSYKNDTSMHMVHWFLDPSYFDLNLRILSSFIKNNSSLKCIFPQKNLDMEFLSLKEVLDEEFLS